MRLPHLLSLALVTLLASRGLAAPATRATPAPKSPSRPGVNLRKQFPDARIRLTAAQRSRLDIIRKETWTKVLALRDRPGTPAQKKPKVEAIMKAMRERVNAVLTPEQRKQLEAQRRTERERQLAVASGSGRKSAGTVPPPPPSKKR